MPIEIDPASRIVKIKCFYCPDMSYEENRESMYRCVLDALEELRRYWSDIDYVIEKFKSEYNRDPSADPVPLAIILLSDFFESKKYMFIFEIERHGHRTRLLHRSRQDIERVRTGRRDRGRKERVERN